MLKVKSIQKKALELIFNFCKIDQNSGNLQKLVPFPPPEFVSLRQIFK